ncbi:MAG: hypothetical protein ACRD0Z_17585 [Acidimicrobiales bacterium]
MPHRIDVELTSTKDAETFTWRAAKARQPKGTVDASLLPAGAKVGDVVRVEAEIELDGIRILSVLPNREKAAPTDRIEVVGSKLPVAGVTTVLAGKDSRRRESAFFRDGSERRGRDDAGRGRGREGTRVASARTAAPGSEAPSTEERRPPQRRTGPRSERTAGDRPDRATGEKAQGDRGQGDRASRATGDRSSGQRHAPAPASARTEAGSAPHSRPPTGPAREGRGGRMVDKGGGVRKAPYRLEPGSKHRDELMAGLGAEQRAIAERLAAAAGSLPALRKAIAGEQERAKAEGRPFDGGEQILAVAEQLLPDVRAAMWLDRAEAAVAHIDELSLRDLRAIVVAGGPRTELGRELDRTLREGHDKRVAKLRADWEEHLAQALAEGRLLQALRLSTRLPEPTARFPAALVETLAGQAGAAMSAATAPDRWLALLAAAELSPVRRQIHPAGIPDDESGEVHRKASEAAGRIPALAALLGMAMPPPPQPLPGERPVRTRLPHSLHPPRAAHRPAARAAQATAAAPGVAGPPAVPAEAEPAAPTEHVGAAAEHAGAGPAHVTASDDLAVATESTATSAEPAALVGGSGSDSRAGALDERAGEAPSAG